MKSLRLTRHVFPLHRHLSKLIIRHGVIPMTVYVTLICIAASVSVLYAAHWVISFPLMPTLYLAFITPVLIAPPIGYLLIKMISTVSRAEADILARQRSLIMELEGRTAAETSLKASEDKFRAVITHAGDAIFLHDAEGNFTEVNEAACHSLGYSREELLCLKVKDVEVGDDHDALIAKWETPAGSEAMTVPGIHRRKDGTEFPVEVRIGTLRIGDGIETLALARDVTERVQAEQKLRDSESLLRRVQELTGLGVFERDLKTGDLHWSDELYRILGLSSDVPPNFDTFIGLIHPEDRARIVASIKRAIQKNQAHEHEYRIQLPDNTIRHIHAFGGFSTDADGTPRPHIGAVQDITARKETENRLRESETRFRGTFENAGVGIVLRNVDRSLRQHNQAFCNMVGYSADEQSTRINDIAHPDDDPETTSHRMVSFEETDNHILERRFIRKDGRVIWCNVSYKLIRDADGNPLSTISMYQDITDRKAAEEQLHEAQKTETLGQLTGGFAHEFNNLLMAITSNLELLQRGSINQEKIAEIVSRSLQAAYNGSELTGQLLSYVGKQLLSRQTFHIHDLASNVAELMRPGLGETIVIETALAGSDLAVTTDQRQLQQSLINLILNAKDSMPDGGTIRIETAGAYLDAADVESRFPDLKPGAYVRIGVTDTGTGMSQEVAEKVFDPFFTTKDVGEGTGLGLSMVYGFVRRQSGGYVSVESEVGHGTTIDLYLPQAISGLDGAAASHDTDGDGKRGAGTILLVEDEDQVLEALKMNIEDFGYSVVAAANGAAALDQYRSGTHIDLLLTDLVMPGGINGFEVAQAIQRDRPAMPVIYMTGHTDQKAQENGVPENAIVLRKPFQSDKLLEIMQECLRHRTS